MIIEWLNIKPSLRDELMRHRELTERDEPSVRTTVDCVSSVSFLSTECLCAAHVLMLLEFSESYFFCERNVKCSSWCVSPRSVFVLFLVLYSWFPFFFLLLQSCPLQSFSSLIVSFSQLACVEDEAKPCGKKKENHIVIILARKENFCIPFRKKLWLCDLFFIKMYLLICWDPYQTSTLLFWQNVD